MGVQRRNVLKKCFFDTYRFSEDLDFSLLPDAHYDETSVRTLSAAHQGLNTSMMYDVETTPESFIPRHRVEFTR